MAPADAAAAASETQHESREYKLVVLQEPNRARMCGGTRRTDGRTDRRPIDPPPIVRLEMAGAETESSQTELARLLLSPHLFCHAALCNPTTYQEIPSLAEYRMGLSETRAGSDSPAPEDSDSVGSPRSSSESHGGGALSSDMAAGGSCAPVFGTTVSSLHRVRHADGSFMGVFVFSDISVRIEASFRLRFSLFEFDPEAGKTKLRATVYSQPFRVYHAKNFPGMTESTYLSKLVAMQSVKMRVRKERPAHLPCSSASLPRARGGQSMARLMTAALSTSSDGNHHVGVPALAKRAIAVETNMMSAASVASAAIGSPRRVHGSPTGIRAAFSDSRSGTSAFRPYERQESTLSHGAPTPLAAVPGQVRLDSDYHVRPTGISALDSLAAAASREGAVQPVSCASNIIVRRDAELREHPFNRNNPAPAPAVCGSILPPLKSFLSFAYSPMTAQPRLPSAAIESHFAASAVEPYQLPPQPAFIMPYFQLPMGL